MDEINIGAPFRQYWTGVRTSVKPSRKHNKESLNEFDAGNLGALLDQSWYIVFESVHVGFSIHGKIHNSKRVSLYLARKTCEGFLP